jgi:hypothetical protein
VDTYVVVGARSLLFLRRQTVVEQFHDAGVGTLSDRRVRWSTGADHVIVIAGVEGL